MQIFDAHIHSWNPAISPDILVFRQFPELDRPLEVAHAEAELVPLGTRAAVLIQSEPSTGHSDYCVEQMGKNGFVQAVSGWLDPLANHSEESLAEFASKCRGTRIMLNRMESVSGSETRLIEFCDQLGRFGITVDLLALEPHLDLVGRLARACSNTTFVLNHSGQPDTSRAPEISWIKQMENLGACKNLHNKLSGLVEKSAGSQENVIKHLDVLFRTFDVGQLMYASNWPVVNLSGGTQYWLSLLSRFVDENLASADREAVFSGTCQAAYLTGNRGEHRLTNEG